MQVFNYFFAIVRRNKGLVILYAAIFLGMTLIISNAAPKNNQTTFEDQKVAVTVIDRDQSTASKALESYLYSRHKGYPVADETEAIQDMLFRRKTKFVLYIPAGYQQELENGTFAGFDIARVAQSYQTIYVGGQVKAYLGSVQAYLGAGFSLPEALELAPENANREATVTLSAKTVASLPGMYYYFTFLCYGLCMMMVFGLSPVLLAMGKPDITARMNVSALPLRRRNMQMALAALTLALACFAALIAIAALLYRHELFTVSGAICVLNAFAYLLYSTALALFIGQVSKRANMISALANIIVMGTCFLGGIFVPYQYFGEGMQTVAKFMPTHWYEQVVATAASYGSGTTLSLQAVWPSMGMLLLFTLALVFASLVVSKQKQRIG